MTVSNSEVSHAAGLCPVCHSNPCVCTPESKGENQDLTLEKVRNFHHLETTVEADFQPLLDRVNADLGISLEPRPDGFHLTIIGPGENDCLENLTPEQLGELQKINQDIQKGIGVTLTGIGYIDGAKGGDAIRTVDQEKKTCFLTFDVPALQEFRKSLKLSPKDFHITVGFVGADIHMQVTGREPVKPNSPKMRELTTSISKKADPDMAKYKELIPDIHFAALSGGEKLAKAEKKPVAPVEKPAVRYNIEKLRSNLMSVCLNPEVGTVLTAEKVGALVEAADNDAAVFKQMIDDLARQLKGAMKIVREALKTSEIR